MCTALNGNMELTGDMCHAQREQRWRVWVKEGPKTNSCSSSLTMSSTAAIGCNGSTRRYAGVEYADSAKCSYSIQIHYKPFSNSKCNPRKQHLPQDTRGAALSADFLQFPRGTRHANCSFKHLSMRYCCSFNICGSKSTTERSVPLFLLTVQTIMIC